MRKQAQVISDSVPFGFWTADADGRMRYLSQSFLTLIGRTEEEAQGLGWLEALAPETAEATLRDWKIAVSARRPWSFEFTVRGTDGRSHTILSRGFPILESDGRFTSWAGINLDITDRRDAEAFREAFAGILSHELRTPITSIYAASTLLSRAGLEDLQRAELLDDINQESERLRRLVEDLVVLARVERGTILIHTEPVLLPHVLRKVCAQEQARWPGRRIDLHVGRQSARRQGRADLRGADHAQPHRQCRQVRPRRRPDRRDSRCAGTATRACASSIADPASTRPRRTGSSSSSTGPNARPGTAGSGIGLFLVHRLIESMEGTIWARPRADGPGAEFGFTLQPIDEDA